MKKEVLISISGLQYEIDKDEAVEVISVGDYYYRNDKHYIVYDEIIEDVEGTASCTMKLNKHQVDIIKRGSSNVHMVFEEGIKNATFYQTPFGELQVGILTNKINLIEEEDKIIAEINYALDINYAHVSDCEIKIKITPRNNNINKEEGAAN